MKPSNHPDLDDGAAAGGSPAAGLSVPAWFQREVLPLEPALMRFLRRHWRHHEELPDLRQDIYIRVYESVQANGAPESTAAFVFACARNLLVDRVRKAQVVTFETVANLEDLPEHPQVDFTPEELAESRQKLRLLQLAIDALSPRCREVVLLRKVEGLSHREIATRLGIAEGTIEKQITIGVRALAESLLSQGVDVATAWVNRMRGGSQNQ